MLLILLVVLNVATWARLFSLERQITHLIERSEAFELADPMFDLQRFADKLYFSGIGENWQLANFYVHEMEEKATEIMAHNVVEGGVEITPLIKTLLVPAIEQVEASVQTRDKAAFVEHYRGLVESCNKCHEATKHQFIQIAVPERSMFQNQIFSISK